MLNRLKLMTLPKREDFSRRGGASLRLISALHLRFLRYPHVGATLAFLPRRAHTRSRGKKPHTSATRASRRGTGIWYAHRVDRDDFFHSGKIGTIDPFQADEALSVALSERYENAVFS